MSIKFKRKAKGAVSPNLKLTTTADRRSAYSPFPDMNKKEIINLLERVTASGHRPSQVFDDWVALSNASLGSLPRRLQAWIEGTPYQDTPQTAELFRQAGHKYKPDYLAVFSEAFAILLTTPESLGYYDLLGDIYMEWSSPGRQTGQFFTPWHVTQAMACMIDGNTEAQINERIKKAIHGNPLAEAMLMSSLVITDPKMAEAWFLGRILPEVWADVEKVTVNDPACGSGIMFLAHAGQLPWWQVKMGLVQYYGQDIDASCVQMAELNIRLHGLNGFYAPWIMLEMDRRLRAEPGAEETEEIPVTKSPPPVSEGIEMFRDAAATMVPPMPPGRASQLNMFDWLK